MNRREALSLVAWITGGIVVGSELLLKGCSGKPSMDVNNLFAPEMTGLFGDIADIIIPETGSPGAKQAGVGEFIPEMIRDCYTSEDQKIFINGIEQFQSTCIKKYQKKFQEMDDKDKKEMVIQEDKEMKKYNDHKKENMPNHYFFLFKQLTLLGYFTSEKGATMALRYVKIPGKYDGDFSYKKGDKAWAI